MGVYYSATFIKHHIHILHT